MRIAETVANTSRRCQHQIEEGVARCRAPGEAPVPLCFIWRWWHPLETEPEVFFVRY